LANCERFLCQRENLVLDSVMYHEPVERFEVRFNVIKFMSFGDRTSSGVKDKLKTIRLGGRQIE